MKFSPVTGAILATLFTLSACAYTRDRGVDVCSDYQIPDWNYCNERWHLSPPAAEFDTGDHTALYVTVLDSTSGDGLSDYKLPGAKVGFRRDSVETETDLQGVARLERYERTDVSTDTVYVTFIGFDRTLVPISSARVDSIVVYPTPCSSMPSDIIVCVSPTS